MLSAASRAVNKCQALFWTCYATEAQTIAIMSGQLAVRQLKPPKPPHDNFVMQDSCCCAHGVMTVTIGVRDAPACVSGS
jgi:hypothetical protein